VHERDLEDLAQEVFLVAYRSFGKYESDRPIRPWLFSIAFRTVANWRRLARHRRETSREREIRAAGPNPEESALKAEARALVHEALDKLVFERRVVIVMHDLDDMTVPEIAEILDVNVNTVYSRLRLGRRDFRKVLKRLRARRGRP
jgi:RNA polymerase sigma-70 factor (ECF subfamily)